MARKPVKSNKAKKFDLEALLTEKVLTALDSGVVPWQKPWVNVGEPHYNLNGKRVYRGLLNQLLLTLSCMENGFDRPIWMTWNYAVSIGGTIRADQAKNSTIVTFYKRIKIKDKATGEDKMIPLLRYFRVYNVAQIDGIDDKIPPKPEANVAGADIDENSEAIVEGYDNRPEIITGGDRAAYSPSKDEVYMPSRDQFKSTEGYYASLFHELGHSTGHKSRKNRKELYDGTFGDNEYSVEELTAEMVSVFLSGHAGFEVQVENSAAYIEHWRSALSKDSSLIVKASTKASAATDLILGVTYNKEDSDGAKEKGKGDN